MSKPRYILSTLSLLVALTGLPLVANAQHHHEEAEEQATEQKHVETKGNSYTAAVASIDKHLIHVAKLIKSKKLAGVHKAAKPIETSAKTLGKLAFKKGSGVPRSKIKQVNLAAKKLAKTWARIDAAGDAGDLAGTKKVYREMVILASGLRQYVTLDNYAAAVAAIDAHREHVAVLIETKQLVKVHAAAKPIQTIAKKLGKLAFKSGSGVDRSKAREVNISAKKLAKTWARIDAAGDAGDMAGTKKVYAEIVVLIKALKKHVKPAHAENDHRDEADDHHDDH